MNRLVLRDPSLTNAMTSDVVDRIELHGDTIVAWKDEARLCYPVVGNVTDYDPIDLDETLARPMRALVDSVVAAGVAELERRIAEAVEADGRVMESDQ